MESSINTANSTVRPTTTELQSKKPAQPHSSLFLHTVCLSGQVAIAHRRLPPVSDGQLRQERRADHIIGAVCRRLQQSYSYSWLSLPRPVSNDDGTIIGSATSRAAQQHTCWHALNMSFKPNPYQYGAGFRCTRQSLDNCTIQHDDDRNGTPWQEVVHAQGADNMMHTRTPYHAHVRVAKQQSRELSPHIHQRQQREDRVKVDLTERRRRALVMVCTSEQIEPCSEQPGLCTTAPKM